MLRWLTQQNNVKVYENYRCLGMSNLIEKLISLKVILEEMEEDLGLAPLSEFEKNIYLAAQALKLPDRTVKTKQLRGHSFTQSMSRPTFFRALQALEEKGLIARSASKKTGLFVVNAS